METPPPIPPASFGPPPRKVKYINSLIEPNHLSVSFIFALIGLALAAYVIHYSLIVFLGTPTTATVLQTYIDTSDGTSYHIEYQYQFGNQTHINVATVDKPVYEAHTPPDPNHPVAIRHFQLGIFTSSDIPRTHFISHPLCFLYPFTFVWCGITWSLFLITLTTILRERRLCIQGVELTGTITQRTQTPDNDNGFNYKITYTFTDPATRAPCTHTQNVPAFFWGSTAHTPSIIIFADPDSPNHHILYGTANWQISP